ncbi:MAG: type III pantothenate kinase [Deltaproteobacteria bacterium]|nr:type III pantothenate kinase [Deltaproteobacteria bacterium]
MLAAIDIGNTNIVVGVFDQGKLVSDFRVSTRHLATSDEYALLLDGLFLMAGIDFDGIDGACMCSVVPPLTEVFETFIRRYLDCPLVQVGPGVRTGISISYETPKDVGADRVANALAAHERFGTDVIIVDFGTATTFDAVTASGEYLGGVIVPGVNVSLDALFARTAKLPRVEMARPSGVIGRNTVHSIQSGAFYGYLSMVEGIVARMKEEMTQPVKALATGGLASLLCSDSGVIDEIDRDLTLHGLRLVWEKNMPRPLSDPESQDH